MASTSRDINFDMARVEGYRNFCNKIWNASRFVLMNTESEDTGKGKSCTEIELSMADRWIWSRFYQTVDDFEQAIAQYRFDIAAQCLYEFTWNQFCDWYLELTKPVLNNEQSSAAKKRGTRHTLVNVLEQLMRLLHPVMPYVTETIWQRVAPLTDCVVNESSSVMVQAFPQLPKTGIDHTVLDDVEWLKKVIVGIRNIRGEMDISPNKPLPVMLRNASEHDQQRVTAMHLYLTKIAKLDSIKTLTANQDAPASASAIVGEMEVLIPMAGLIDKQAELARIHKSMERIENDVKRTQGKLHNDNFVSKAPAAVIEKEQQKLADASQQLYKLQEQKKTIEAL
jgi:valyl-tRNA synthetase